MSVPKLRFPEFLDSGEWEEKKLGEIAAFHKGKGISKADIDSNGKIPCVRYGELYTHYKEIISSIASKTNLPIIELFLGCKNDVIIPSSGETKLDIATASCLTLDGVALGGDINVIRCAQNGIFMSYYLNGCKKFEIAKKAQGDTVVHLYSSQLRKLDITLPTLPEQQKIADCLSSLDDRITAENQKLDTLKAHKKGLMQQLFPAEGETLPKLRFPEFTGDWFHDVLSSQMKLISGLHLAPDEYDNSKNKDKIPYFTGPSDFTNNISEVSKWTSKNKNFASKGNTLLTVKGSGVGQLMYLDLDEVAMGRQLMAISAIPETSKFIFYCLDMRRKYFEALASGNMIPGIARTDILSAKISFPPSKKEQKKIADCLSSIDDLITVQAKKIDTLKTHKKGLMQQLFPAPDEVKP